MPVPPVGPGPSKQTPQQIAIANFYTNCRSLFRNNSMTPGTYTIGIENGIYSVSRDGQPVDKSDMTLPFMASLQKLVDESGLPQGTVRFTVVSGLSSAD